MNFASSVWPTAGTMLTTPRTRAMVRPTKSSSLISTLQSSEAEQHSSRAGHSTLCYPMDLRWPVMCNGWFGQGLSWSSSLLAGLGLRLGLLLCFLTLWTFHCLAAVGLHFLAREQHDA